MRAEEQEMAIQADKSLPNCRLAIFDRRALIADR
jgi:hypothetical protein